jgi:putative transposase
MVLRLEEIYGVEVGRDLISKVTDAVMQDARAWQTSPLDDVYPLVFLDALVLKIRDGGTVQRKACYLVLGINLDGDREVLGMWFQDTEGAKFWMQVLSELKQRGVQDILIACVDGLKGFPEAIEAVFPATTVQTCIVHYADIRNMAMWLAKPSGGGRLRAVGVGIIRALRETRARCRVAGSGLVWRPVVWCVPGLSL